MFSWKIGGKQTKFFNAINKAEVVQLSQPFERLLLLWGNRVLGNQNAKLYKL